MTSCELKAFHNRTVSITFRDGEVATARLTCTSEDCDTVMVDILGTNHPESYAQLDTCSYVVPVSELDSVVEMSDAPALPEPLHLIETTLRLESDPAESLAA